MEEKNIALGQLGQFLVFLKGDEDDPMYVRKFKKKLKAEMIVRCGDNLNIELYWLCQVSVT